MGMGDPSETTRDGGIKHSQGGGTARLVTVGVGGCGVNAVNHMIEAGVRGVEFLAMNTDAQALELARTPWRLRLGERLTRGQGAGGDPLIGRRAAEESYQAIRGELSGADLVFIAAGMGGGTGMGASPLVAQPAREQGALTLAVVTTPFAFERRRKLLAPQGAAALREEVDALIVVPNERLMQLAGRDVSVFEAYRLADDVLRQAIQGISDLITIPGLINLDFADIRSVLAEAGSALMAVGQAGGQGRADAAAKAAITNPLLGVDIGGARGIVFNITGSDDLTLAEVDRIAAIIGGAAHPDASITFGTVYDPGSAGTLKVTVVATGFEPHVAHVRRQQPESSMPDRRPTSPHSSSAMATSGQGPTSDTLNGVRVRQPIFIEPLTLESQAGNPSAQMPPPRTDERALSRQPQEDPLPRSPEEAQPPPRTDERAPLRRPSARSVPRHGAVRVPRPAETGYAPRAGGMPGRFDDEFLANDEDALQEHPAPRSGWERLFGWGR